MIKIKVLVQPNAKVNQLLFSEGDCWKIKIKAPAQEGKANAELINFLAEYFAVSKRQVKIVYGFNSRLKIIEIDKS